jgi:hypothetical protein
MPADAAAMTPTAFAHPSGLSAEEATARLNADGPNELPSSRPPSLPERR